MNGVLVGRLAALKAAQASTQALVAALSDQRRWLIEHPVARLNTVKETFYSGVTTV
jgi:hypothetical protein